MTEVSHLLTTAADALRTGDDAGAERLYAQVLRQQPKSATALHGLACIAGLRGRDDLAIGFAGRAIALSPEPVFHITLGQALAARGHVREGLAALRVAVLGAPEDGRTHAALAHVLERAGQWEDARQAWIAAARRAPFDGAVWVGVARTCRLCGDPAAARDAADRACACAPVTVDALQERAAALAALGLESDAERAFAAVVSRCPDHPAALSNHGAALFALTRLDEAREVLTRSVGLAPDAAESWVNLGLVEMALGHLGAAAEALERAVALRPDDPRIRLNQATLFMEYGRLDEASAVYDAILDRTGLERADAARARFNRATVRLAQGDWHRGWEDFEARHALLPEGTTHLPDWDGSAGAGRVLVEAEQGLGDQIQFLRAIPAAARRVPLCLIVAGPLRRLVRDWLRVEGLATRVSVPDGVPDQCVARCALGSLTGRLEQTEPPIFVPYLGSHRVRVRSGVLRVGLCWGGNPSYRFDRRRSIDPALLACLQTVDHVRFVSLQYGVTTLPFAMEQPPFDDFASLRDIISGLDLVISVDTAVAHLAGAMGCPVWLLNRFGGDWRWFPALRSDGRSVWYPSLRIWPVETPVEPRVAWTGLLRDVGEALTRLAEP
ncbi:tetratricopeptide repeat protein [Ameyamaea chiangmaiensis]|nr:tetratricopeptide repeat protein [Ameyamaea chiangmaiensis]MBS4073882.1 tetratricopeptide repeat protein [Ameyamaea chiangmaiensis]